MFGLTENLKSLDLARPLQVLFGCSLGVNQDIRRYDVTRNRC